MYYAVTGLKDLLNLMLTVWLNFRGNFFVAHFMVCYRYIRLGSFLNISSSYQSHLSPKLKVC